MENKINISIYNPKSLFWLTISVVAISLFGINNAKAQNQSSAVDIQEIRVTGIVTDGREGFAGANVEIKRTNESFQTDVDGKFNLKTKENDTLVISGYQMIEKEVSVAEAKERTIILKPTYSGCGGGPVMNLGKRSKVNKVIEVSGIVSDEYGPLPGVNIIIKGTTRSTQTDVDGKFKIEALKNQVFVIQHVGYHTKNLKVKRKKITIKLEEYPSLD